MKKYFLLFVLFGMFECSLQAQYLLDEFTVSIASSHRSLPLRESFNYNCETQSMEFKSGDEIMKLTDIQLIDTLYLGAHKMVPYATRFLDVIYKSPEYSVLVDYKYHRANKGKTGAMGIATHAGGVENIELSYLEGNPVTRNQKNIEAWDYVHENSYMLYRKNKLQSFRNQKQLTKLFPDKTAQIEQYFKDHKVNWGNPEEIVEMVQTFMQTK